MEELALVFLSRIVSILECFNCLDNESTLLSDIMGELFSSTKNVVLGFDSCGSKTILNSLSLENESSLELFSSVFKGFSGVILVGVVELLEL